MANDDYGYFGKGSTGYAQYMTAFNRNFGGSSGGRGGNHGGGGGDGGGCAGYTGFVSDLHRFTAPQR